MVAVLVDDGPEVAAPDELAGLPTEALAAEVRTVAAEIAAATCRFVLLVGELDRRDAWGRWECRSGAHWLAWQCGMSLNTGYEHVRVGRALAELPEMTRAFAAGRLSYSKVRALTQVATPESEVELVGLARETNAVQLDRIVSAFSHCRRLADPDVAARQIERRSVWTEANEDGTITTHVRQAPDAHGRLWAAIDAAAELVPEPTDRPDSPAGAQRADALGVIVDQFLAPTPERAAVPAVVVHVDLETLIADRPGRSEVEHGPNLCAETARRLVCDAGLTISLEDAGRTLDVGRRTRSIPPAMRRAVMNRDQATCRWPGCTNRRHLQVHHRRHWARHGGRTAADNLLAICTVHHRALHEGGWSAERRPDGSVTFVGPKGQRLSELPLPPPPADPGSLRRRRARTGHTIEPDAIAALWKGEHLDLNHAISAMFGLIDPDTG